MNGILLTCSSRKIHIIDCIKKSLKKIKSKTKLFLSDSNSEVISRYFSNNFWKSPVLKKSNFNKILRFLLRNNIKIIFPSADSELLFWSNYKDILKKKKIFVMISEPDTIRICLDKYLFYTFLVKNNITTIPTSLDINSLKVKKYVVKNRFSQGKKNNFVNLNYKTCKILSQKIEQPIFQKFIKGDEISIDCYVGSVGNCKILMRYRRSVNHGESEHTVFFKNKKIYKQIKKIINKLSFFGHIMFQGIISKGIFYVMECNPRIGGASIVCFYKNLDSFFLFINENLKIKKNRIITPRLIKNNSFILHKTVTSID